MNWSVYNHCGGLAGMPEALLAEITSAIADCPYEPRRGVAKAISSSIISNLIKAGWSGQVPIARSSKITITSIKHEVGLCLQTGNMARVYADMIKLQQMYNNKAIKAAVMIVPTRTAAKSLGDNIAQANRLQGELEIFRSVIHMPLVVLAID